jgi:SAM-dependent methyltransferase
MDKAYEAQYHLSEESNWWFVARRDFILRWLQREEIPANSRILDVGSGGGALALFLHAAGYPNVTCIDFSEDAIAVCKSRGINEAFVHDAQSFSFDEPFDLLIASDCLEHLENDRLALQTWFKNLKPGGSALILVPAHAALWSQHDVINHHYRRYSLDELHEKVATAGFQVKRTAYWNATLFLPLRIMSLLRKKPEKNAALPPENAQAIFALPSWVNALLIGWLKLENKWIVKRNAPCGVSVWASLRKPA